MIDRITTVSPKCLSLCCCCCCCYCWHPQEDGGGVVDCDEDGSIDPDSDEVRYTAHSVVVAKMAKDDKVNEACVRNQAVAIRKMLLSVLLLNRVRCSMSSG